MKGNKIFDFSRKGFQDIINIMTNKINECVDVANGMIARLDDYISKVDWNKIINSDLYQKVLGDLGKTNEQLETKASKNICINVKDFGAIGDWASHPLSEKFNSLEEAKKVYPKAESLSDEIDRLAIQKAFDSEYANFFIPYGQYQIDKELIAPDKANIKGGGKHRTALKCKDNINCIKLKANTQLSDLSIKSDMFQTSIRGSINTGNAIECVEMTGCELNSILIIGFNKGINYGSNSWTQTIKNVKIMYCNEGIFGSGEFNDIQISKANITYCQKGVYVGGGRTIVIRDSDIERNNVGIHKVNEGDVEIVNNYFELNSDGSVNITWGQKPVDFVYIGGNTFFEISPCNIINYHTDIDNLIVLENNYFSSYGYESWENNIVAINPKSTNNKIRTKNNKFKNVTECLYSNFSLIINDDFKSNYNPSKNAFLYSAETDFNSHYNNGVQCVRITKSDNIIITLPFLKNGDTFKFVIASNSISDVNNVKYISPIGTETILNGGLSTLKTNVIYNIIFGVKKSDYSVELFLCT